MTKICCRLKNDVHDKWCSTYTCAYQSILIIMCWPFCANKTSESVSENWTVRKQREKDDLGDISWSTFFILKSNAHVLLCLFYVGSILWDCGSLSPKLFSSKFSGCSVYLSVSSFGLVCILHDFLTVVKFWELLYLSYSKTTKVEWRFTEDGERVRVSLRTGRIIPLPPSGFETWDYKTPETYLGKLDQALYYTSYIIWFSSPSMFFKMNPFQNPEMKHFKEMMSWNSNCPWKSWLQIFKGSSLSCHVMMMN